VNVNVHLILTSLRILIQDYKNTTSTIAVCAGWDFRISLFERLGDRHVRTPEPMARAATLYHTAALE
jgi:hypothetical protein